MSDPSGSNPMRWNCNKGGPGANCFNRLKRPKIEVFKDCFPGKISFGDVDGIVEINGKGLLLEWKPGQNTLKQGQNIMYKQLTKTGLLSVIVVCGNAETMEVTSYSQYCKGKHWPWKTGNLEDVKTWIRMWVS